MLPNARRIALLALPFALLAGCGDGSDPIGPVATLPVAAVQLAGIGDTIAPITLQPVLQAVLLSGFARGLPFDGFDTEFVPVGARATSLAAVRGTGTLRVAAQPAAQLVPRPITIPDSLRGRTFVRDTSLSMFGMWRLDTLANGAPRPGAPADGIRFMLTSYFSFDATNDTPLGFMDFRQQGTGTSTTFTADVYDLVHNHVLHYVAPSYGTTGSGWTAGGGVRVDQTTNATSRGGVQTTRWTGTGVSLSAERRDWLEENMVHTRYTLDVRGKRLQVESAREFGNAFKWTYTILVDGAPFARRTDTFTETMGTWQHVAEKRPLTEAELAQVRSLLRALALIPDAQDAWAEGFTGLMLLTYPLTPR